MTILLLTSNYFFLPDVKEKCLGTNNQSFPFFYSMRENFCETLASHGTHWSIPALPYPFTVYFNLLPSTSHWINTFYKQHGLSSWKHFRGWLAAALGYIFQYEIWFLYMIWYSMLININKSREMYMELVSPCLEQKVVFFQLWLYTFDAI